MNTVQQGGLGNGCCDGDDAPERGCVFARALLAQAAPCACARRDLVAERTLVRCGVPTAQDQCRTLMHLLHERARFALRLPPTGRPLMHAQALRLQCGGLQALRQVLAPQQATQAQPLGADSDVCQLVGLARERHGSLTELPWPDLVAALVQWQPRPRRSTRS